jgi:hypothetical protein
LGEVRRSTTVTRWADPLATVTGIFPRLAVRVTGVVITVMCR